MHTIHLTYCHYRVDTNNEDVAIEQVDKFQIHCPLCHQFFDDARQLSCGHSFCFQCLVGHVGCDAKGGSYSSCPTCHNSFLLPQEGVQKQSTSKTINSLMKCIKGEETMTFTCSRKGCIHSADHLCHNGCDFLCTSCLTSHGQAVMTMFHQTVPIQTFCGTNRAEIKSYKLGSTCKRHFPNSLDFVCRSCRGAFCGTCILSEHQNHPFRNVTMLPEQLQEKVRPMIAAKSWKEIEDTLTSAEDIL